MLSSIGIPVYFHYCGGELEKINYLVKTDSCCGDEEIESETNDCCEDEEVVLISSTDFIVSGSKSLLDNLTIPSFSFFYHNFNTSYLFSEQSVKSLAHLSVPINLQKQKVLSTIILRV